MDRGKKESFSLQILQIADAGLVWLAFWLASVIRDPVRELVGINAVGEAQEGLSELTWILLLVVPSMPFFLMFSVFTAIRCVKIRRLLSCKFYKLF